ncbi:Uncharacterised protein [Mycobacterium tuberculosis]|nr:Uncharacterised protein [Mycobacterium tuberculosis]
MAVGRGRPGGSHFPPVAPTAGSACRDRWMGWAGLNPVRLHAVKRDHAVSGNSRFVTRPGRGAGYRRRLCRIVTGLRPCSGAVANARDRPRVLLVVSVALAGTDPRTGVVRALPWAGRQADSGPGLWFARDAHTAFHRESAALRASVAQLPPAESRARRWGHRGSGRCGHGGVGASPGRARPGRCGSDNYCGACLYRLQRRGLRSRGGERVHAGARGRRGVNAPGSRPSEPQPTACRRGSRAEGDVIQRLSAQHHPRRTT